MRLAWLWLALAACSSEGSLEVRVVAPASGEAAVEKVELYVGIYDATLDSIRPAHGGRVDTVWWARDPDHSFDVQDMSADGALFAFQRGNTDDVAAVVAVGLTSDPQTGELVPSAVATQLVSMDVPTDEIHRYILTLGAFDPLPRDDTATPRGPGLQVWGPPDDPRKCVEVDNVPELAALGAPSAMIVDPNDPDCDAAEPECDDRGFMSATRLKREDLDCSVAEPQTGCVLGGPGCMDGAGDVACLPSNYCVPTGICESGCANLQCEDPGALLTVPYISCDISYLQATADTISICQNRAAFLNLAILSNTAGTLQCDTSLHAKLRTKLQNFDDKIDYPNGFHVELHAINEVACQWDIFAKGEIGSTVTNYVAGFAVPFTQPTNRGLGIPIVFHLVAAAGGGCDALGNEGTCTLVNPSDPGLRECIAAPVSPETIVQD